LLRHYDASLDNPFPTFRLNGVVSLEKLEEPTCHSSGTIGSLKMVQLRCFETSETDYPATRRHIRHETNPQIRRCEKLKIAGKITLNRKVFSRVGSMISNNVFPKFHNRLVVTDKSVFRYQASQQQALKLLSSTTSDRVVSSPCHAPSMLLDV